MDEHDLVQDFLGGDRRAIAKVRSWVHRVCLRYRSQLGDDYEDTEQDVLMGLMSKLGTGSYESRGRLQGYVSRFTYHKCIDRLRAKRRLPSADPLVDEIASSDPIALDILLRRADQLQTARLIAEMPESCRELWEWIAQGLSYREMASRAGVSEGALRVRVLRCRRRAKAARDLKENDSQQPGCNETSAETIT